MWWMTVLTSTVVAATPPPRVYVDRAARELWVLQPDGSATRRASIGVGRGGLGTKTTMSDLITPTGTFTVDLVITAEGDHNAIAPSHRERWSGDPRYGLFIDPRDGLQTLYRNMSSLDFNADGAPDGAYGVAYVGLDSTEAVTGPKMRQFRGTPYWYSIALHGTPDPSNLGAARSGGCVHVGAELLRALIADGTLAVGQTVIIADGPPPR